jgi:hypothetical protein
VKVTPFDFVVSATDVAVTVTEPEGGAAGGVYRPLVLTDPILPPAALLTCQVTAVFVVPVTFAANC